ncbi:MAG: HEAT repeat domain-containing protein, partial [Planctomycetota bacterium]
EESLPVFKRVYEQLPESTPVPACLFDAGVSLRELGRYDEAHSLWQRLLDGFPDNAYAERVRKGLVTLQPPRDRLRALIQRYREALGRYRKLPYKERGKGLKEVKESLGAIGEVRIPEAEGFLLRALERETGNLQAAIVPPLLKVGGARSLRALLDLLAKGSDRTAREILAGLEKRHLQKISLRVVVATYLQPQGKSLLRNAAIGLLGRVANREAAQLLVESLILADSEEELGRGNRRTNDLIRRELRSLRGDGAIHYLTEDVLGDGRQHPLRRFAAAEALGYCGAGVDGVAEVLRRALAESLPGLARAAAESLGRLGAEEAVPEIAREIERRGADRDFLEAALEALGRLDPAPAEDLLLRLSRAKDVRLRTLAVRALGRVRSEEAFQRLLEALADAAWQVRSAALTATGACRRRELVDTLVERLSREEGVLLPPIVERLIELMGVDLGPDPRRWQEHWRVARRHFEGDEPERQDSSDSRRRTFVRRAKRRDVTPSYFGLEIISKRVAFVVDVSGSMGGEVKIPTEGGETKTMTKMELAREELLDALPRLQIGTSFNIVRFNNGYTSFSKKPRKLSPKALKESRKFVKGLGPGGATNIYDSLEFVLQSGAVDTLYLLSDGEPTAGKYTGQQRILDEIARLNGAAQVIIHTIALGYESSLLKRLAAQNRGEYVIAGGPKKE